MFMTPIDTSTATANANTVANTDPQAAQDRFLKLFVAQLNNQDPLNPMDNAEMTTQMAQINTVSGIQQLNETMKNMQAQFASLQVMQGTTLVGRTVLVEGNKMARSETEDIATGTFDLAAGAKKVTVEIRTPGGQVLDKLDLGSLDKGRHTFEWDSKLYPGTSEIRYVVSAVSAKDKVEATPLMQDKVTAAGAVDGRLSLTLQKGGVVAYDDVKAIL